MRQTSQYYPGSREFLADSISLAHYSALSVVLAFGATWNVLPERRTITSRSAEQPSW